MLWTEGIQTQEHCRIKNGLSEDRCYYTLVQLHRLTQYADIEFRFLSDIATEDMFGEAVLAKAIQERIKKLFREDERMAEYIYLSAKPNLEFP